LLKRGSRSKADLRLVAADGGSIVVKDFARKAPWVRWLGRVQISRECRAYSWIADVAGPARWLGRIDAHALALELIEGRELAQVADRYERAESYLGELARIVRELHERGVTHLDLRGRDNVMVDLEGRVRVLDLGAAVRLRPGSLAHRLGFGWLKLADDAALLKWKDLLRAGPYTDEEAAFLRRFRFWRALWVFNRKIPADRSKPRTGA
jgi:serine/threonine protein kinase